VSTHDRQSLTQRSTPTRLLPEIDGGSYQPHRIFIIRRGGIELAGTNGQDNRPHSGVRLWKAERVHTSGRRARSAMERRARNAYHREGAALAAAFAKAERMDAERREGGRR
jgi:hypothetical protein